MGDPVRLEQAFINILDNSAEAMSGNSGNEDVCIESSYNLVFHLRILKDSGMIGQDENRSYFITKEGEKVLNFLKILEDNLSIT